MFVNMFEENNEFARDAHFETSNLTLQGHILNQTHTLKTQTKIRRNVHFEKSYTSRYC